MIREHNTIKADVILSRVINKEYAIFNHYNFGPTFGCSELDLFGDHGSCTNLNWAYEKQIREATYKFLRNSMKYFK